MFAKVEISGVMEIVTGLHIGGSSAFAAIGAVDSPVIRDPLTGDPIIPGSSLKGKMRTLLAKKYNEKLSADPNDDALCITELFGTSKKCDGRIKAGKLLFSDMFMLNKDELKRRDIRATEVKFENTINRSTAVANPRQIERVIRGAKFGIELIYEVTDEEKMPEDFRVIADGMKLLEYDYLGGNGSRGYGKVKFSDLYAEAVIGEVSEEIIEECNKILEEI